MPSTPRLVLLIAGLPLAIQLMKTRGGGRSPVVPAVLNLLEEEDDEDDDEDEDDNGGPRRDGADATDAQAVIVSDCLAHDLNVRVARCRSRASVPSSAVSLCERAASFVRRQCRDRTVRPPPSPHIVVAHLQS